MKLLAPASIGLAALALALGYALHSLWAGAGCTLAIGLLWLAGQRRGWDWTAELGLAGYIGLAAFGIWQALPGGWMLVGLVLALVAWDLDHFTRQLRRAGRVVGEAQITQSHLRLLLAVAGIGLLLGGVAIGFRIELGFGWALAAFVLAILSMKVLIGSGQPNGE
jgi:hypothetical protein